MQDQEKHNDVNELRGDYLNSASDTSNIDIDTRQTDDERAVPSSW